MKTCSSLALLLSVMVVPALAGNLTFLSTPGAVTDSFLWSGFGVDQTLFVYGSTANSAGGNNTTINGGTQPALGGLISVAGASWPTGAGYNNGDSLLWTEGLDANGNAVGTGPLTFTLLNAVGGLGAYLQTTATGSFTASLAVYNGALLLGSLAYSSNTNGDPLFLGVRDSIKEITRAVFSVTSCGAGCDVNDFSQNTLQIYSTTGAAATPEPATFAMGGSILAIGFALRSRRARRNN